MQIKNIMYCIWYILLIFLVIASKSVHAGVLLAIFIATKIADFINDKNQENEN